MNIPATPPKPAPMPVNADAIPPELRDQPRWVVWRWTWRDTKWTKPPLQVTGKKAKVNDPNTWTTFQSAVSALDQFDGIGFVLGDGIVGIDLDDCRDPETGKVSEPAQSIILKTDSYAEVSPSAEGVKLLCRGTIPDGLAKVNHPMGIEVYDGGRYFCLTGHALPSMPTAIEERPAQISWLLTTYVAEKNKIMTNQSSDDIVVARAALAALNPSRADDYDPWLKVGMACKATSDSLLHDWDQFSRQSDKYQPGVCEQKWDSFKGNGIGLGTLIQMAKDDGWTPPKASTNGKAAAANKRQVVLGVDEDRVIDEAIRVVEQAPEVYQRGGSLAHIVTDATPPKGINRPADSPRIASLPDSRLRELLATRGEFVRLNSEGEPQSVHPPGWVISGILGRGQWPNIRPVEMVLETPVMRPDGTVLCQSGYDADTGIYLVLRVQPVVLNEPTLDDAIKARDELLDVVQDFPFAQPEHGATWLAAVLTPFARPAYEGTTPLFLCDANAAGVGKGLLLDAVAAIATGRDFAKMANPRNDEEARKKITAIALAAEPLVLIDNASGMLGAPSLDAALTATAWSDRLLGASEMTGRIPLITIWFATGNNIVLSGDIARRTAHIRLETPEEKPEERTGFAQPNLLRWVRRRRGRLVSAALTILRGYIVADRPDMRLPRWGSFDGWSDLVRQAVVRVDMPDPTLARQALYDSADSDRSTLKLLIDGWEEADPHRTGLTAAEAIDLAESKADEVYRYPTLREALMAMATKSKMPTARSLGMKLHHVRGRIIGGKHLDRIATPRGGVVWGVHD